MGKALHERLEQARLAARSPLYRWLWEHRQEVDGFFKDSGRPAWEALATVARESGIPTSRQAVQVTWGRVQEDIKRAAARSPAPKIFPAETTMPMEAPAGLDDEFLVNDLSGKPIG